MTTLSLEYIESGVAAECARLIMDQTWQPSDAPKIQWRLSGAQIDSIAAVIGPRLTRLALAQSAFRPAHDESDDWCTPTRTQRNTKDVETVHPADFLAALEALDVDERLAKALGLVAE